MMKPLHIVLTFLLFLSLTCSGQSDSTVSRMHNCVFETQPSFPGGTKALFRFIGKNLVYPKHQYIEGTVYVSLMINEDGSLSDLTILKGVCEECDRNAIEVFKKMPKWIPAMQGEKAVKGRMILPLKFTHS